MILPACYTAESLYLVADLPVTGNARGQGCLYSEQTYHLSLLCNIRRLTPARAACCPFMVVRLTR